MHIKYLESSCRGHFVSAGPADLIPAEFDGDVPAEHLDGEANKPGPVVVVRHRALVADEHATAVDVDPVAPAEADIVRSYEHSFPFGLW